MLRQVFIFIFFIFLFVLFHKSAFAVSVTISDYPSTITEDAFTITASVSGATTGTNYLKIDIFKDQTTNYFGETFNGSDWYGDSTYSQYLSISIQSGVAWSGSVQGRIGSPTSTQYDGNGTYKIRLRRYTSGGGYTSSEANSSAVVVSIVVPTSTPIPTFTPTPTSTPTPTTTPTPTKTPTPSPTKSPSPTLKPTPIVTLTSIEPTDEVMPTSVLGESTESGIKDDEKKSKITSVKEAKVLGVQADNLSKILISIGIIFLITCGILVFRSYKQNREKS